MGYGESSVWAGFWALFFWWPSLQLCIRANESNLWTVRFLWGTCISCRTRESNGRGQFVYMGLGSSGRRTPRAMAAIGNRPQVEFVASIGV